MVKQLACKDAGSDCAFMVRSENDDELVSIVQQHGKKIHKMDISKQDVMKMAKTV